MPGIIPPGTGITKVFPPAPKRTYPKVNPARPANLGKGPVETLTGDKSVKAGGVEVGSLDVKALQRQLVRQGYQVAVDGKLGPITKSALADYLDPKHVGGKLAQALAGTRITGNRNVKQWNTAYGTKKATPVKPQTKTLDTSGNPVDLSSTSTATDPTRQLQTVDYRHAMAALPQQQYENPGDAAKFGPKLYDLSLADKMAGGEFDPQIAEQQSQLDRLPRDKAQALADIRNWMGQVTKSQTTAAGRDHAISKAGISSIADAVKAITGSLGGDANAGSGMVAASGADSVGTLTALGANQDQYQQDLAPILNLEREGQLSSADAKFGNSKKALLDKLAELRGARGASAATHGLELQQANNGILDNQLQYRTHANEYNNGQGQQDFNNKLALQSAITSSILANAKVIAGQATADAKGKKPAKGSFGYSTTADRTGYTGDVLSQIAPGGKIPSGMTPAQAKIIAQRIAGIYWPNGGIPNGTGLISNVLAQAGYH